MIAEWEALELASKATPARVAADRVGVAVRTVRRYRARRPFRCGHCRATFLTRGAAWDHFTGADRR